MEQTARCPVCSCSLVVDVVWARGVVDASVWHNSEAPLCKAEKLATANVL